MILDVNMDTKGNGELTGKGHYVSRYTVVFSVFVLVSYCCCKITINSNLK